MPRKLRSSWSSLKTTGLFREAFVDVSSVESRKPRDKITVMQVKRS